MNLVEATLALLGHRAEDRVTGYKGVITSVCFDLYGCVQCAVSPPAPKEGKMESGHWFDVSRVKVSGRAVMTPPNFAARPAETAAYDQGASDKPPLGV